MTTQSDNDTKTNIEILLPKILPGTVHEQFVRCGKPNCKCKNGELHGPYYYHFIRLGGKLKKRYLKASEIEEIQVACLSRREEKRRERGSTNKIWKLLRGLRDELRAITCRNEF